ncbi:cupin domain-containing protein [Novosphingobium colocasiae]|uniref:Cupin domain-containing protein n=1 Tax=Novosphingobium colocasiae TaxID=1256513 RepID=A0A918PA25_9SPHN|nr:cupin domain-containing protein [Novosphingobium colocasiae]GGY93243.1 hypothetical protein GCM10011614_05250 [Novosphingobium colocasiae]
MATRVETAEAPAKQMKVFRRNEGPPAEDYFDVVPNGPIAAEGLAMVGEAGMADGAKFNMLYIGDDFTLLQAWMKPGYPLPLHTHNTDCLYFVSRGSMKLGTVELNAGDGVFMPARTPYKVTPGEDGVEFLEFRPQSERYDMQVIANNQAFWGKALGAIGERRESWQVQERPA